jgi:hypothetical protein
MDISDSRSLMEDVGDLAACAERRNCFSLRILKRAQDRWAPIQVRWRRSTKKDLTGISKNEISKIVEVVKVGHPTENFRRLAEIEIDGDRGHFSEDLIGFRKLYTRINTSTGSRLSLLVVFLIAL